MENLSGKDLNHAPGERGYSAGILPWVLAGGLLGLLAANVFLFQRTQTLEMEVKGLRANLQVTVNTLREATSRQHQATRQTLDQLALQLEQNREKTGQTAAAVAVARSNAQKHAEKLVERLAAEQRRQQEELDSKLGHVSQAHATTSQQVNGILTDVGSVRNEITETKTELDKTIADLRSVRGDLGIQSGLIATNSKELAALRELGERNYYEFDIYKKGGPVRLANVALTLRKTDDKRYKYTLDLIVNDRKVEKKDKYINEPVQFYVPGSRLPHEIVVNEVKKDRIIGYISAPKPLETARR